MLLCAIAVPQGRVTQMICRIKYNSASTHTTTINRNSESEHPALYRITPSHVFFGLAEKGPTFPVDISHLIAQLPPEPSYLNEVPFDIKDYILSFIDEPRHLLSMSLVSKDWAALIIPNHIEYRILHARIDRGYLWAHLFVRADLAKNIHTVRFLASTDRHPERFPVTLCPPPEDFEELIPLNMIKAISNLKSLRSLTWTSFDAHHPLSVLPIVFGALLRCHNLEELRLGLISSRKLEISDVISLWKLRNIKKLTLRGNIWAKCIGEAEDPFIAFLNNLPELKELTISYNPMAPGFTACALPKLTKLHLWPEYGTTLPGQNILSSDVDMLQFIASHPTIEDLRWYPIDQGIPLPQGFLPSLKRILSIDRIAKTILNDHSVVPEREMELISQISLGPNTLNLLQRTNGAYLQELHIWRFDDLSQIRGLAELFPNIRSLNIANFTKSGNHTIDECIHTLGRFQYLEHFLDSSLWLAIGLVPKDDIQKTVNRLAAACPYLKSLRHWKREDNFTWDVVLKRRRTKETWMFREDVSWAEEIVFDQHDS